MATPWESVQTNSRGGVTVDYLTAQGYTAETYNALAPWERAEIMKDATYGEDLSTGPIAFVQDWAQYAGEEAQSIGEKAAGAVQGAATLIKWLIVGVIAVSAVLIVRRVKA